MNKIDNTFSDLLIIEKETNIGLTNVLLEGLKRHDIILSPRTIQKYIKGELIPSFAVAKLILEILKVNMTDTSLRNVLENSYRVRNVSRGSLDASTVNLKSKKTVLNKRVLISCNYFDFIDDKAVSVEESIDLIMDKVQSKYGTDRGAFNRYIGDLINEDMKK